MRFIHYMAVIALGLALTACGNDSANNNQPEPDGNSTTLEKPPLTLDSVPNTQVVPADLRPPTS